ncbi:MAG: DUF2330 domain-containing protein [Polyangiaceae bacterium]
MRWQRAWIGLALGALLLPRSAAAFLVVGTDAGQAAGPDTRALVLREETRSVVAVSPSVRGPAAPLAIVMPIPASAVSSLRVVPGTLLERTDQLAAPRLDELWELDPCELHPDQQAPTGSPPGAASTGQAGGTSATQASAVPASAGAPRIEGDYAITVLVGEEAKSAGKWLSEHGYRLPDGAEAALAEAIGKDSAVVVARIEGARLVAHEGVARLPPLSFVTESSQALPLRLAGVGGAHDTIVDVLSGSRFEAANLVNVAVPTNLDVTGAARADVSGLYGAVLDFAFEKAPGAAITEHAWLSAGCDGCPGGGGIGAEEVLALGADRLPSAEDGSQREVMIEVSESLARAPEGPAELKRAAAACYSKALAEMAGLAGEATVTVETGEGGAVVSAKTKDASAEALGKCVEEAVRPLKMDHAKASGSVKAKFALVSRAYLGQMVLTRLRVRSAKGAASELTLRAAAAIEGGREEGPTGEPEKKVYFAEQANNFGARYVMRHPWGGAIACGEPHRGVGPAAEERAGFAGGVGLAFGDGAGFARLRQARRLRARGRRRLRARRSESWRSSSWGGSSRTWGRMRSLTGLHRRRRRRARQGRRRLRPPARPRRPAGRRAGARRTGAADAGLPRRIRRESRRLRGLLSLLSRECSLAGGAGDGVLDENLLRSPRRAVERGRRVRPGFAGRVLR